MKIHINEKKLSSMKKDANIVFNIIPLLLIAVSIIIAIYAMINYKSSFDLYLLVLPIIISGLSLIDINNNKKQLYLFFNRRSNSEIDLDITQNETSLTINNISDRKVTELKYSDINRIIHAKETTIIFSKNKQNYILPNIKDYINFQEKNKPNFLIILLCIYIAFSCFFYIANSKEKISNVYNLTHKEEYINCFSDIRLFDDNSISFVSETLFNNGLDMTDMWHCNYLNNNQYNDTTISWLKPNDNYIYFSEFVNKDIINIPISISNTDDYNNIVFSNLLKIGDLIYFSNKKDSTKIFVSIIIDVNETGIHCISKIDNNIYRFYLDNNILNDMDLYVIHIDGFN